MRRLPLLAAIALVTASPALADARKGAGQTPGTSVEIVELKRDGAGSVTATVKIVNDGKDDFDLACQIRANSDDPCEHASGIYLIDTANKKRHLVVRDTENLCVCSDKLDEVEAKSSATLWAKFPEPPAGVATMTVVVPHFVPLDGVALTGP